MTVPAPVIDEQTMIVVGTDDRKMSKSHDNVIPILAEPEVIRRSVISIVTDSRPRRGAQGP